MTFPVFAGNSASTGYNLTRSLRFRSSASASLSRTPSTPVNQPWTLSLWIKRGKIGVQQAIIQAGTNGTNDTGIYFTTNDTIDFYTRTSSVILGYITTTPVYRDPSAWYHMVFVYNAQTATAANRMQIYANNVLQTVTVNNTLPQNTASWINSVVLHAIGGLTNGTAYLDGYLTEVNFIDGQALTPSSFGSTNTLTGVWQPARYTGTYGTNGFYLPFTDNSALTTSSNVGLGKDFSGNGNYWTTNNISITSGTTYDSMTDVPTLTSATAANFAVANPLQAGSYVTLSNGNLTVTGNTSADSALALATIGKLTSGKWYWEYTQGTVFSETCGVMTQNVDGRSLLNGEATTISYGVGARANGDVYGAEKTTSTITSWTSGDVIGLALDCDNGAIYWSKNGTWLNSGVPTSESSKTGAVGVWTPSSTKIITPSFGAYNSGFVSPTFGQRPFAYTPPTGFVALNTFNLPTSTIVKGNTVMDATLYTGNSSTQTITNAGAFKPDFVWIKNRNNVRYHILTDSVRGTNSQLFSNDTLAQETRTDRLTAFNSNGFSVGSYTDVNLNADTFVGWQWQAGQGTTSSNTSGTITSTVSVNASAGFSVVTYTGTGANATVGHGLGVAPQLVIAKLRSSTSNWPTYHRSLDSGKVVWLDLTDAQTTSVSYNGAPTSSIINLGTAAGTNTSGGTHVIYAWTPIAGYSAFGSYNGSGSADGPMVYTGFQPRWLMIKRTDSTADWFLYDTARSTYNVSNLVLFPNSSSAEATGTFSGIDILSNGFKIRGTGADINASGGTYIYMAFATCPFRNSLAQ